MSCHDRKCLRCGRCAREWSDGCHVFRDAWRVYDGPLCRPCLDELLAWLEPCPKLADLCEQADCCEDRPEAGEPGNPGKPGRPPLAAFPFRVELCACSKPDCPGVVWKLLGG